MGDRVMYRPSMSTEKKKGEAIFHNIIGKTVFFSRFQCFEGTSLKLNCSFDYHLFRGHSSRNDDIKTKNYLTQKKKRGTSYATNANYLFHPERVRRQENVSEGKCTG